MKDIIYLGLCVVAVVSTLVCGNRRVKDANSIAAGLKAEILLRDAMIRLNDSTTVKLVSDNYSRKRLQDRLGRNKGLVTAPVIVARIDARPDSMETPVFVEDDVVVSYYPDPADWYIRHRIRESVAYWDFQDVGVDIAVHEKQKGLYEAVLTGPPWLVVNRLDFYSLPLHNIGDDVGEQAKRRWAILAGLGMAYNWKTETVWPKIQFGYRSDKNIFLMQNWLEGMSINYIREFR